MARSKSSGRWLTEHEGDDYVHRARKAGFRSRAIYKLMELDEKDHLFHAGMRVVDLGAAPGGWAQYVIGRVGSAGKVVALDILSIEPITGVDAYQADFTEDYAVPLLGRALGGHAPDLVMSDMAPNMSGVAVSDQAKAMHLVELAADFAGQYLAGEGVFLVKVFQGVGFAELIARLKRDYRSVVVRKPRASRPRSNESYVIARGRRGQPGRMVGGIATSGCAGDGDIITESEKRSRT